MFDWQAYDDGSLTLEEKARHDDALKTLPSARSELEGLRSLKQALRQSCLQEPIPELRLQRLLNQTAKRQFSWPQFTAAAAVVVAIILVGNQVRQPINAGAPVKAEVASGELETTDYVVAQSYLSSHALSGAPVLKQTSTVADLHCAKFSPGVIEWDITYKKANYRIVGRKMLTPALDHNPGPTISGDFVSWNCRQNMIYQITGGTAQGRLDLAKLASQDTPSISTVGLR